MQTEQTNLEAKSENEKVFSTVEASPDVGEKRDCASGNHTTL